MEEFNDNRSKKGGDLLDVFYPQGPPCAVPRMTNRIKPNTFDLYRPTPGEYMDYSISQTDAKLDSGYTKIHLCQTSAKYVDWPEDVAPVSLPPPPPPPTKKKKKITYQQHREPCWIFLDEMRAREIQHLQEQYCIDAKKRQATTKRKQKKYGSQLHDILLTLVGPDWYQELAPKQLEAADELKYCILTDLQYGTIVHVKENMAKLGLVLRPNPKHLLMALKYCCECPVEFLLILYQIMNPKRTEYSLNDRLLLSAVVHLTMTDTLRELHVRIPSPPPRCKVKPAKSHPKPQKKNYKSPYLEPFNFKPPDLNAVNYKKHYRQYPESIYFSYIDELKQHQENYESILQRFDESEGHIILPNRPLTLEEDLVLEWQRAQESYERLKVPNKCSTPVLRRANVHPQCKHEDEALGEHSEGQLHQILSLAVLHDEVVDTEINTTDMTFAVGLKITSEYDDKAELSQQLYEWYLDIDEATQPTYHQCINQAQTTFEVGENTFLNNGVYIGRDGKPVYLLGGITASYWVSPNQERYCKCIEDAQAQLNKLEQKFVLGGVSILRDGSPVYTISYSLPINRYDELIEAAQKLILYNPNTFVLGNVSICRDGTPTYHIQNTSANRQCKCELMLAKEAAEVKRVQEDEYALTLDQFKREELKRMEWEEEYKSKLMGIEEDTMQKMRMVKSSHEGLVTVERQLQESCCMCKKAVERFLKQPRCTCERCRRDLEENRKVFIVEGTSVQTGEPIQIITGITGEKDCQCLERYLNQVAAYEERKSRQEAVLNLKSMQKKYVISGVTKGPDGEPIFILSGLIPKYTCSCPEKNRLERERIKTMPEPLPPDRRWIISGIRATPEGNIWIINGASPLADCDCMKLYNRFLSQHSTCMELYEAFVRKIKRDTQSYMEDLDKHCQSDGQEEQLAIEEVQESLFMHENNKWGIKGDSEEGGSRNGGINEQTEKGKNEEQVTNQGTKNEIIERRGEGSGKGTKDDTYVAILQKFKELSHDDYKKSFDIQVHQTTSDKSNNMMQKLEETFSYQGKGKSVEYDPDRPHFILIDNEEPDKESDFVEDESQEITLELQIKRKKRVCICQPGSEGADLECKCAERMKKKPRPPREFRRYILLSSLPCNYEAQMIILKQALSTLAEDGFPLAKLPDCHLLPHFKLWWRWRCGIYISQEDRLQLLEFSKKFWGHSEYCHRKVDATVLKMSRRKARTFTWGQADYIKQLTSSLNYNYFRKVKQAHIADGREFFPTLCDYDLPTKNFRDCIFAYIPWKEEVSFASHPWHPHEFKEMRNAKHCI